MGGFECHRFKVGYLDESGDNGKRGSKNLVLTHVCTKDNKKIAKIIKNTKDQLRRTKRGERWLNRHGGEIKFTGFPDKLLLIKTLGKLSKLDINIRFISIKKNNNKIDPEVKKEILFDLLRYNFSHKEDIPHKIIADKDYFNNKKVAYFIIKDYEEKDYDSKDSGKIKGIRCNFSFIEKDEIVNYRNSEMIVSIKHENSRGNVELQATDLISGAIFREIEHNDKTYSGVLDKNLEVKGRIRELK